MRLQPLSIDELAGRGVDVSPYLHDFDELPGSVATLGYRPDILNAVGGLWQAVMGQGLLDPELKYLAGYLASMSAGCRYCSAHTATNAAKAGTSARVAAVWDYERSDQFDERTRAALRFAQLAGQSPGGVGDAETDALKRHFRAEEIVELLAVVGIYGFFNRWNDALATPLEASPRGFAEANLGAHGWDLGAHG
ncbi:carboxymuconolactone decarboxylase family protein [Sphingomonas sp.]|uniref:carboxymuconolactone decarboxylase family protein n=1 Tax=Sphingomonas sp. TaxID=28214 RepID=UPI002DD61F8B|nr:carboxymuconolactone decarboxylase family protein [Sphingomonas sp.]